MGKSMSLQNGRYDKQSLVKTRLCPSLLRKGYCSASPSTSPSGCSFAHSLDDVRIVNPLPNESFEDYVIRHSLFSKADSADRVATQPCKSIMSCGKCPYKNCTFAHTFEQLSPIKCRNDGYCRYRTCFFIHSYESKDEYTMRMGINLPKEEIADSIMYFSTVPSLVIDFDDDMDD